MKRPETNTSLISIFDDEEKKKQLETILALALEFDENISLGLYNPYHGLLEIPSDEHPTIYYALCDINEDGYDECFLHQMQV